MPFICDVCPDQNQDRTVAFWKVEVCARL